MCSDILDEIAESPKHENQEFAKPSSQEIYHHHPNNFPDENAARNPY